MVPRGRATSWSSRDSCGAVCCRTRVRLPSSARLHAWEVAAAEQVPVQVVGVQVAVGVVEGDRPERMHGRQLAGWEGDRVGRRTIERAAVGVGLVAHAEVLLGRVAQDAQVGAGRAGQVVVAEQVPAAEDLRGRLHGAGTCQDVVEPALQASLQLCDVGGVGQHTLQVGGVSAADADGCQGGAHVGVLGQGRHESQHPGQHTQRLHRRPCPHVDRRDPLQPGRRPRGAVVRARPVRQGPHAHLVLQGRDVGQVSVTEQLGAHQHEAQLRRACEDRQACVVGRLSGAGDQERAAAGPVGARRDVADDVGVEVEQLGRDVATRLERGQGQHDRSVAQVQPGVGVGGVDVHRDDRPVGGVGQAPAVGELPQRCLELRGRRVQRERVEDAVQVDRGQPEDVGAPAQVGEVGQGIGHGRAPQLTRWTAGGTHSAARIASPG